MGFPVDLSDIPEGQRGDSSQKMIDEATNKLRVLGLRRGIDLDAHIFANSFLSELAATAVINAVVRQARNPDGYFSESIDDWSGQRDRSTATGKIYIDTDDVTGLFPTKPKIRTIRTGHVFG